MTKRWRNYLCALLTLLILVQLGMPAFAVDFWDKNSRKNEDGILIQPTGDGRYQIVEVVPFSLSNELLNDVILLDEKVGDFIYRAGNRYFMQMSNNIMLSCDMLEFSLQDTLDTSFLSDYGFSEVEIANVTDMCNQSRQENWVGSRAIVYTTIGPESDTVPYVTAPNVEIPDLDWDVGYKGYQYRQSFIEYKDLGCPFTDIASGLLTVKDFLANAFILGMSFYNSNAGTGLSIVATIGSLFGGTSSIIPSEKSILQFGGGWEKTTCSTYIYTTPSLYPSGKLSVFADKVRFTSYQFNYYDPSAVPANRQTDTYNTNWFISDNYESYEERQKIAYEYKDSYLLRDERLHEFILNAGSGGEHTVRIAP